jgi:parvulin-like peptidyl-prolyl isomerase
MLKTMRHNAKYFYVLFFIVILSFMFWGVGTIDKTEKGSTVAEVEKHKISSEEYWRAYDRAFNFYKEIYKEKFDEEMQKKLNLRENILNSLIENKVLLIAARNNGVVVDDNELNEAIKNEPAFMKNGAFDNEIYVNRLRLNRLTPESYESAKRQEMTVNKFRRIIELSATLPESDAAKISGDEKAAGSIRDAMLNSAKNKTVKAYIEGLKKGMKIKIYKDVIS